MNHLKTLLLLFCSLLFSACSAPMPGEDVGLTQEALTTCSITGDSGSALWPPATYITNVRIVPVLNGIKLGVTACDTVGTNCLETIHTFLNVHWAKVNLPNWSGSVAQPLRRVKVEAPGCQLDQPTRWCMTLYGDLAVGDHINLLQNATRFTSDKPIATGVIEAPVGYGITKITGYGSNVWQMRYANASGTGLAVKNWSFTAADCN